MSDEAEKAVGDVSHFLENQFGPNLAGWPVNPTKYFGYPAREAVRIGRASRDAEVAVTHRTYLDVISAKSARIRDLEAGRDIEQQMLRNGAELVASLRECIDVLEADLDRETSRRNERIWELEEQIAARDAVIERAKAAWFGPCAFDLKQHGPAVTAALAAVSPSTVLAEHDARVLEDAADDWGSQIRNGGAGSWLRERAAERRKGTGQ